jgi:predicted PurR-regulated permease PerM
VSRPGSVPIRTIAATIGMVVATFLLLLLVMQVRRVLIWAVIALFFAVALYPAVNWVEQHVPPRRRTVATLLVFLGTLLIIAGLVALFVVPLAREATQLATRLPDLIKEARNGEGPLGDLVTRFDIDQYIQRNEAQLRETLTGLGTPVLSFARAAATTIVGIITIFVLAYLMALEGPKAINHGLKLLPADQAERVRRVGTDCAKAITGYISGNLLISVICGSLTYVTLLLLDVPFSGLIALFVAVADLIPLVGATLGAVVATVAALTQSPTTAVIVIVFFVLYQQFENHVLQPLILSRTVQLNPLTVLLSVLIGVELAGILGALLAIPVVGVLQVVFRDLWDARRRRLEQKPAVGDEEAPETATAGGPTAEGRVEHGQPPTSPEPAAANRGPA